MATLKPSVSAADHKTGNTHSGIILVEYGDYECPHCGHAYPLLKRLVQEVTTMTLVFRNFPLQEIHTHAFMAATAAEAAAQQRKFWEMHDLIFEHQRFLSEKLLFGLSEKLELDKDRFMQDWKSEKIAGKVEADFESGIRSGVNGTPGFFLNGKQLFTYDGTYESLVDAIALEEELSRK